MVKHVSAVVENGQLRLTEPLDLPEGREVELAVRVLPTPEEQEQDIAELEAALKELREAAAEYPPGMIEEFQRELQANRLNFPERFISQFPPEEQ